MQDKSLDELEKKNTDLEKENKALKIKVDDLMCSLNYNRNKAEKLENSIKFLHEHMGNDAKLKAIEYIARSSKESISKDALCVVLGIELQERR